MIKYTAVSNVVDWPIHGPMASQALWDVRDMEEATMFPEPPVILERLACLYRKAKINE